MQHSGMAEVEAEELVRMSRNGATKTFCATNEFFGFNGDKWGVDECCRSKVINLESNIQKLLIVFCG